MIYAYIAGHGCVDISQYFMMNESDPSKVLVPIENELRKFVDIYGNGACYVLSVYDICRKEADAVKSILEIATVEYEKRKKEELE